MRFHVGLSFNWKTLKKWFIPIILGILMYFGFGLFNNINVYAEAYTPVGVASQIRTIYNDETTEWYTSATGSYDKPLYFHQKDYYYFGIPCNFRLQVIDNIESQYSYKYDYTMTIFVSNIDWDPKKIDQNYEIKVRDDVGVVKDSNCSVVNTEIEEDEFGTLVKKDISCVFSVNKSYSRAYMSAGYFCKGDCQLSNMEHLGYISTDSYMTITNPKFERFNDNSNIVIDQNQTIIDQNNQTNEKLDDLNDKQEEIKDSITDSTIEEGTGNSFFDNFQTEDNGGISGIITAPLTLINSLLDGQGTCTDLKFPIMGKEVSLPSGCIIWDKVPNEMEVLIQTLVCGTGAYFLLKQLFKDIEKLKNPNNSEVSTLDL